jgi:hypothetical protein
MGSRSIASIPNDPHRAHAEPARHKLTIISMAAGDYEQDRWHVGQIPQLEAHIAGMTGRRRPLYDD